MNRTSNRTSGNDTNYLSGRDTCDPSSDSKLKYYTTWMGAARVVSTNMALSHLLEEHQDLRLLPHLRGGMPTKGSKQTLIRDGVSKADNLPTSAHSMQTRGSRRHPTQPAALEIFHPTPACSRSRTNNSFMTG